MSRLIWNRHWTLIFALGACLSLATLTPHRAVADPSMGNTGDDNGNIGGGSTGLGDPDVPDGAGKTKTAIKSGRLGGGNLSLGSRAVGDGRDFQGTVMWRLYVAWVGYRSFWLHF